MMLLLVTIKQIFLKMCRAYLKNEKNSSWKERIKTTIFQKRTIFITTFSFSVFYKNKNDSSYQQAYYCKYLQHGELYTPLCIYRVSYETCQFRDDFYLWNDLSNFIFRWNIFKLLFRNFPNLKNFKFKIT